jgi:tetratricopeptide (TPR) repeat protein
MRKQNNTYYFSVEGETEKWYLEWLQQIINAESTALYTVKFDCKVQKDPLKRAKSLVVLKKTEITHVADRESEEDIHVKQFETMLNRMKEAGNLGKNIKYNLGYSHGKLGQHDKAIEDCNKAIELAPNFAYAYNNRGYSYGELGQYDKAMEDINKSLELDANNEYAYTNRGTVYKYLKQYDKAVKDYEKALEINSEFEEAHEYLNNLG